MISKIERFIAFRYLKPKKKEGFLKVISIFSFTGIALGVAILIIVMSVMNGFRIELIDKILGFNPHIVVEPYIKKIDKENLGNLDVLKENISRTAFTFSGQGILINKENTIGILVRSYLHNDIDKIDLIKKTAICKRLGAYTVFSQIVDRIVTFGCKTMKWVRAKRIDLNLMSNVSPFAVLWEFQ